MESQSKKPNRSEETIRLKSLYKSLKNNQTALRYCIVFELGGSSIRVGYGQAYATKFDFDSYEPIFDSF